MRLLAASLCLALIAHAPACGANLVPGTKVALEPPSGFTPETQFPGFRNANGASIMVTEIPGPIDQLRAGLTKSGLAGRGMTLLETSDVKVDGRDAQLFRVSQAAQGIAFEKWVVVFGTAKDSVFILATYPESDADSLREPMKKAVLSASWKRDAVIDRFEGLPFRVSETATLKIANRMSNLVMLTEDGVEGPVAAENPLLVVGASISEVELTDLKSFCDARLRQIEQVSGVRNLTGRATEVDGLPAYELTADADDKKSGEPLRVYQLIIADGSRYFLAQGLVGAKRADAILPQFREIAASIRRRE